MTNALAEETSPYLRQHAGNPVDWLPWGERALRRARDEDRPLLVSIGYSACHWCHVMERESFEDERTAQLMNRHFVCVKVDREERPDVDAIYMDAVQAMTGHGGWPLNVFLTPEQLPFYGGTYFPPQPRAGMPSWPQVLEAVAHAWETDRERIRAGGERVREQLSGAARLDASPQPFTTRALDEAMATLGRAFDREHGGFGGAPKFPPSSVLEFLLARAAGGDGAAREMALATLRGMAGGGIHDQVGGGFARYSVDGEWLVPHFEKMLYDNALLARAYLHGWQLTGDRALLDVCLDTLGFALRELRADDGGFHAALDADSEGHEGRFYVWTVAQLREALGDDAEAAIAHFQAGERGNFAEPGEAPAGENVLQGNGPSPGTERLAAIRARLLEVRAQRVRPGLDDKRIASWNALMISALAQAGAALSLAAPGELDRGVADELLAAARGCAEFVLERLRTPQGRLLRTYNAGSARLPAYLEDHAFLLEALLALYEATFEERWFVHARELADLIVARFSDPLRGGFFSTADDHPPLAARRKEVEDAPIPAGSSSAAMGLLRLAALTGEHEYERQALGALALVRELATRHPLAFGHALLALDFHLARVREIALAGEDRAPLERVARSGLRPHVVLAGSPGDGAASAVALLEGRGTVDGHAAAYVCEGHACRLPVTDPGELAALLASGSED